jgi:hypothetical protein
MANQKTKFLIICNARTGSTWLSTTLGSLNDTYTEYEFKWKPLNKNPVPLHYILDKADTSISKVLDSFIVSHEILGSRLVLGPRYHSQADFDSLRSCLSPNLKIIHIYRQYEDILFSWAGPEDRYIKSTGIKFKGQISDDILKDRSENFTKRSIKQRIEDNLTLITLKALAANPEEFLEFKKQNLNFRNYLSSSELISTSDAIKEEKFFFPKAGTCIYLRELLANDMWIHNLRRTFDFLSIPYESIANRLAEIVSFIGSNASAKECSEVLNKPVVSKVVSQKPKDKILYYKEFSDLCKSYMEIFENTIKRV